MSRQSCLYYHHHLVRPYLLGLNQFWEFLTLVRQLGRTILHFDYMITFYHSSWLLFVALKCPSGGGIGESIAFTFSFNIPSTDTDVVWLAALLHVYLPDSHHLPFPSPLTQFQVNHTTSSASSFLQAFLSGSRSKMCGDLQKCCAGIDDRFFAPN